MDPFGSLDLEPDASEITGYPSRHKSRSLQGWFGSREREQPRKREVSVALDCIRRINIEFVVTYINLLLRR